MEENQSKKKIKIVYIIVSVLVIVSLVELVLLLNTNNKELQSSKEYTKIQETNYNDDLKLGDSTILFDSGNVSYDNTNSGLTSTNVKEAIDELYGTANTCVTNLATCNSSIQTYQESICPGCVYRKSTTMKYNSNVSSANGTNNKLSSSEYTTDYTTLNSNYFLGHVIDESGYILASYACGINNGTFFCLRGVDSDQSSLTYKPFYQEGVNRMNKAFPSCNATTSGSRAICYDGVRAYVYPAGDVYVQDGDVGYYCAMGYDGASLCY